MKLQIPNDDVNTLADWAELYVLTTNNPLSKGTFANFIKANFPEISEHSDRESLAASAITEMQARSKDLYGPASHYKIDGDLITPLIKLEDFPEIALCLIFSLKGVIVQKGKNNGTKLFEQISDVAAKTYIGESILVGFPNNANLNNQIADACVKVVERKGHEDPVGTDKDGGVDIIAWRGINDMRSNKVIVLFQCGAGKHYDKKKPINIEKWKRWVHWAFEPVTGMTTPKIIRDTHEWKELSDYYSLILDRPRLARFVHNSPNINLLLRQQVADWCLNNIN